MTRPRATIKRINGVRCQRCTKCKRQKPADLEHFYKKLTGLTSRCKCCISKAAAAARKARK